MVVTQATSTTPTGHLLCFWLSKSKKNIVPAQEAYRQQPVPNYFPATEPKVCSSVPFPAHSIPASPNCSLLPKHTMLSHAFAVLFLLPRYPSTQLVKLTHFSFFKTQAKCHLFRELFSNSLCRIGHPPLCFPSVLCIVPI